ncbi:hypothetical protein QBC32DRAFT_45519 [Pseudoneurospora amorphoporcata]|uniref:Uncharacterized protein n=1 Tax=Pseudoneurospora amorphoporcata TaxID=241081 RepID=A0AAN6SCV9_9PEZI|nr:hypothetical protein QBC32DRAFT_45519 [Pseudoneurospora amorphoporcata]
MLFHLRCRCPECGVSWEDRGLWLACFFFFFFFGSLCLKHENTKRLRKSTDTRGSRSRLGVWSSSMVCAAIFGAILAHTDERPVCKRTPSCSTVKGVKALCPLRLSVPYHRM